MSKLDIATRLADEIGTTTTRAKRFVEDIGGDRASQLADDLAGSGSRSVGDFVTPAVVAGGGIGGGYLVWRQQDVETAQALAEQASSYNDAVRSIAESNLPPDMKEELINQASEQAENRNSGDGSGSNGFLDSIFNDPIKMVFALVLMLAFLQYVLADGIGGAIPEVSAGVSA